MTGAALPSSPAALFATHISRLQSEYEKLLEQSKFDALVVHSGRSCKQREVDDQYWPLKVSPSFAHWLPLQEEGALLIIAAAAKPKLLRPNNDSFWEGPAPSYGDHFWDEFEVVSCRASKMREHIPVGRVAFVGDDLRSAEALGIPSNLHNPAPLLLALDATRTTKSDYEVHCLVQATRIAARGHVALDSEFHQSHSSELELHLRYLQITSQNATETPYGNIVAQGSNAAILHHIHYDREPDRQQDQSLLVDAGANCCGYASDITRTTVRGQSRDAMDFRALIAGLETVQRELCAEALPGLAYETLHERAHDKLAALLVESGIGLGSREALVREGVTRAFFPHGLGHSLGLQVHDVGCRTSPPVGPHPFLRNTSVIAPRQVFTIEPGCYFIAGLLGPLRASAAGNLVSWPTVAALSRFGGIRIEDNLLVGNDSSINLTRDNWPQAQ